MIGPFLRWLRADPYARGATDYRRSPNTSGLVPDAAVTMRRVMPRARRVPPILDERPIDLYYLATVAGVAQIPKPMAKPFVVTSPLVEVR